MTGAERVRAELEVLGLDASAPRRRLLRADARRARRDPRRATCCARAARPSCWSPGSRSPPRPRRSAPGAGSSSSPSTTPPARSTRPSSRTSRVLTPQRSSTPGCCWSAACVRRTGPRGVSLRATGAWELSAAVGGVDRGGCAVHAALAAPRRAMPMRGADGRRGRRGTPARDRQAARPVARRLRPPAARRGRRRPAAWAAARPPGAGARQRVQAVALRRHQAAGRGRQGRAQARRDAPCPTRRPAERSPRRASSGTRVRAAPGTRV